MSQGLAIPALTPDAQRYSVPWMAADRLPDVAWEWHAQNESKLCPEIRSLEANCRPPTALFTQDVYVGLSALLPRKA